MAVDESLANNDETSIIELKKELKMPPKDNRLKTKVRARLSCFREELLLD